MPIIIYYIDDLSDAKISQIRKEGQFIMVRILYALVEIFNPKKPYFSKDRYMSYAESDDSLAMSALLEILVGSTDAKWFDDADGARVTRISKYNYKFLNEKYAHLDVVSEWVEWR